MNKVTKNITIENAHIGWRNFSGLPGQYNAAGRRNFVVFFDGLEDYAAQLKQDGWNIRMTKPKEDSDAEPVPYLQVAVMFGKVPPLINLISSTGKVKIDEDTVGMLDWVEIANVDLIIRPHNYDINGRIGVKAYLKTMYITIVEDVFASKYKDVPESAQSIMMGGGDNSRYSHG